MTERLNNNNKKLGTRKVEYLDYIRKKFPYVRSHITFKKEMASHSSVLAWRIPGTREPGGPPSMGHTEVDTTEAT